MNHQVIDAEAAILPDVAAANDGATSGALVQQQAAPVVAMHADSQQPSIMGLLQIAVQQGAPIESLNRLLDLQERVQKMDAERAFNEALARFKGYGITAKKDKTVSFQSKMGRTEYKHAELSDVVAAIAPALSECGFSWNWRTEQPQRDWVQVTCILKHRMGYSESVTMGGPVDASGGKNAIQAIASTVSYLERYTLKAITGTAESGDDDDGRGGYQGDQQGYQYQQGNGQQQYQPQAQQYQPQANTYAQADFDKNAAAWRKYIESGMNPQALINKIESKGVVFTEQQKADIRGFAPAN